MKRRLPLIVCAVPAALVLFLFLTVLFIGAAIRVVVPRA